MRMTVNGRCAQTPCSWGGAHEPLGVEKEHGSVEYLVKFAAGADGRNVEICRWIDLSEHAVVLIDESTVDDPAGVSAYTGVTENANDTKLKFVVRRSFLYMIDQHLGCYISCPSHTAGHFATNHYLRSTLCHVRSVN